MPGDLAALPRQLQRSARVDNNGEVSWPDLDVKDAVNALVHAGFVVLGLDVRFHDDTGRSMSFR
jgi:hypothetical protein